MRLRYDATAPDAAAQVAAGAKRAGCALVEQPRAGTFRLARIGEGGHAGVSDQKHCLRLGRGGAAAGLDRVALTPTQAMRANSVMPNDSLRADASSSMVSWASDFSVWKRSRTAIKRLAGPQACQRGSTAESDYPALSPRQEAQRAAVLAGMAQSPKAEL